MTLTKKHSNSNNIFSKSLGTILMEWSYHNQAMLQELLLLSKQMNETDTLNKYNTWKTYSKEYLTQIMNILSKGNRLLYSGITIIMISIFLYVIDASS